MRSGAGVQGGCVSIERRREREAGAAAPAAQNRGPHLLLHAPLHETNTPDIYLVYSYLNIACPVCVQVGKKEKEIRKLKEAQAPS